MESNANFIPLGAVNTKASFDVNPVSGKASHDLLEGKTNEERKEVARAYRLAAQKKRKKIKSDAKKQRAQNAIMHRRMTKNPEKYAKNKDRNRIRAIDAERHKIRLEAVRQAERLAAKHDHSGKMFNIGEIIVLDDGTIKNKASYQRSMGLKAARGGSAASNLEMKKELTEATTKESILEGVNPARIGLIQGADEVEGKSGKKISGNQQKKLDALQPMPVSTKPVLPDGISIPDGDKINYIALWDISDEGILKRLSKAKSDQKMAARALRKVQQEQKKFNRAMKIMKKQAANKGEIWDPLKAKKEILEEQTDEESEEGSEDDSGSSSDSISGSDDGQESGNSTRGVKKEKKPEVKVEEKKKSKRSAEEMEEEEPKPKKRKKSKTFVSDEAAVDPEEPVIQTKTSEALKEKKKKTHDVQKVDNSVLKEGINKTVMRHLKQARKDQKRAAAAAAVKKTTEEAEAERLKTDHAYRKEVEKKKRQEEKKAAKRALKLADPDRLSRKKKRREKAAAEKAAADEGDEKDAEAEVTAINAEHWNPDALNGDAARKDKFLRLLGAGKAKSEGKKTSKKAVSGGVDIEKVQNELERQYEAGMKMKHEGGGKRRGLGA